MFNYTVMGKGTANQYLGECAETDGAFKANLVEGKTEVEILCQG